MSLEDLARIGEFAGVVAVFLTLLFLTFQVRQSNRIRDREAAMELVHSFQTPEVAEAIFLVMQLPAGLSKAELEERLGGRMRLVYTLWSTWESLGVLVHRGEIELGMLEDFFSGPVVVSWKKLARCVEDYRAETDRETMGEWWQWLAERMMEREETQPPLPANVEFRDWRPEKR
jgi:hypothetical protein